LNEIVNEQSEIHPNNPYGESKARAEKLIDSLNSSAFLTAVVFRFFNVAGAYKDNNFKDLYENHDPETHLIPNLVKGHATNDFCIYGNDYDTPDGTCVRDYLHVLDIVDAFLLTIKSTFRESYNLINLGTAKGYSVLEVVTQYKRLLNKDFNSKSDSRRPGDVGWLVTSNFKANKLIGWVPTRDINSILYDYL
jgi:UDP-glucose 4-epimerase